MRYDLVGGPHTSFFVERKNIIMTNPRNFGTVIGNLAAKPTIFPHNGKASATAAVTVYVRNNYKNKDGSVSSQRIDLSTYLPDANELGILEHVDEGMLVSIPYHLESFTIGEGENATYGMSVNFRLSELEPLESKTASADRRARTAAYKAGQQGQAQPAQTQAQAPVQQQQAPVQYQQPAQNAQPQQAQAPVQNYAPADPYEQVYVSGIPVNQQNTAPVQNQAVNYADAGHNEPPF